MKIKHITQFNCRLLLTATMATAIFSPAIVQGQAGDSLIDISHIKYSLLLKGMAACEKTDRNAIPDSAIPQLAFSQVVPANYKGKLSPQTVEKDIYLKFTLFNPADTLRNLCFYPGHFARVSQLFMASPGQVAGTFHEVHDSLQREARFSCLKTIFLQPHEKAVCFVRLRFARTDINLFMPQLMEPDYVQRSMIVMAHTTAMLDMVTYLVSGLLLMMILYSLAVYLQNRGNEFLYYAGYALSTGTLLFLISFLGTQATPFNMFYGEYLDLMILCTGVICYLIFMRKFLNTREQHRFLEKVFQAGRLIIPGMLVIFSGIYFFTDRFTILNNIENICKQLMLAISAIFIVYGIRKNNKLMNYLVAGNAALFLFSIVSFLVQQNILFENRGNNSIFSRSLLYYEAGLLMELTFFLSGLAYKNRVDIVERVRERERLKLDNERKEFEKQMAVMAAQQEERDRISADMHDELGSGVTAIRLMSEIVKSKMKQQSFPEIEKISNSANDLLGKMNTIIWTMKSSNDTLESLVAYIRAHAIEFFDSTQIDCMVFMPELIPATTMSGEKRRNIFLSFKESLNNIIKHSQAGKVVIDIITEDDKLLIRVKDDGVGINTDKLRRFGNGLSNMRRRMENINGEFRVESNGVGSVLIFEVPL